MLVLSWTIAKDKEVSEHDDEEFVLELLFVAHKVLFYFILYIRIF